MNEYKYYDELINLIDNELTNDELLQIYDDDFGVANTDNIRKIFFEIVDLQDITSSILQCKNDYNIKKIKDFIDTHLN